METGEESDSGV